MSEKKRLDHSAYGGIEGKDYEPFVPASVMAPELTIWSMVIGCILAIVFGAANTYLALKVGMTIAAGIPAAILGTGILRIFGRKNILEANVISGTAAMGESLAGGIVFTLPAIIIWGMDLNILTIVTVILIGGLMGIFFIVPVRKYLILEEHGKLAFPESMAAAEVLVTGNQGGSGFKTVLVGLFGGGIFKFLSGGLMFWSESPSWNVVLNQAGKPVYQTMYGVDAMASLAGVGFIVGVNAALYMFAGSVVAYFALMPLIKFIGASSTIAIFPATIPISQMSMGEIRGSYIRYIGAGAVAAGGFLSLAKSMPTIFRSFKAAMGGLGKSSSTKRTELDVPMTWVIAVAAFGFFLTWFMPNINGGAIGGLMAVLFSFFFAVVSARICGIIGASNNPVSGMTIATLLFTTSVFKAIGKVGDTGMLAAILVGGVVCVAIAVAGGAGQAQKTAFIIGGTPKKINIAMFIGLAIASVFAGLVMMGLINVYGIGAEATNLAAPQATLMSLVVQGVMTGQLPWTLILVGVSLGVMCELMGLPVLPVALGIYLPISLSSGILFGGIVRLLVEKKFAKDEELVKIQTERGVLLASGLVAGDAILGIVIAACVGLNVNIGIGSKILPSLTQNNWVALVVFTAFVAWMYTYSCKVEKNV